MVPKANDSQAPRVILDTTVQLDRRKMEQRRLVIDDVLSKYKWKITSSISLLEFKATMIQECITIHGLLATEKRFTTVQDRLSESGHRQRGLRMHIIHNMLDVYGVRSSFRIEPDEDARLAEKARLRLEQVVPLLHSAFQDDVDCVLRKINCTRAFEVPEKKRTRFQTNLPQCTRENKKCTIESFIRDIQEKLISGLDRTVSGMSEDRGDQLRKTLDLFRAVREDVTKELSSSDCRNAGDYLILLECRDHATHALSTNAKEWQPLCELLGLEFEWLRYE